MAKKLLLIEDSLSIQALVETAFAHEDVDIIVTDNALDGLHKARTLAPDIVLADASMPEMDGFQLCQGIRQTISGRHIPIVLLTSSFAAYDTAKGDLVGVTTHLGKPFASHVLIDLVKQYVPVVHSLDSSPAVPTSTSPLTSPHPLKNTGSIRHTSVDSTAQLNTDQERVWTDARMEPLPTESPLAAPALDATQRPTAIAPSHLALSTLSHGAQDESIPTVPQPSQSSVLPGETAESTTQLFYHTLGYRFEQILRETVEAHLPNIVAQIMPRMLDTARAVAAEKMPAILQDILQQEIDKLKRAAEQGSEHD